MTADLLECELRRSCRLRPAETPVRVGPRLPPPSWPDLDEATTEEIVGYALAEFGPDLAVTSSFQDTVLVDVALSVEPSVEIAFLDTGFHFPETLALIDAVERRYRIDVVRLRPASGAAALPSANSEQCCLDRKVEPLRRHLAGRPA